MIATADASCQPRAERVSLDKKGKKRGRQRTELNVVVVDPSAVNLRVAVERSDAPVGEETSKDGADESSDSVKGEAGRRRRGLERVEDKTTIEGRRTSQQHRRS
jgi:hypothetical protein